MLFRSGRSAASFFAAAGVTLVVLSGCTIYDNVLYGNRPGTVEQPGSGADPSQPAIYVVASGDTVDAIGRRFNVPPQTIIERNSLRPPYRIVPGQWLELPPSGGSYASSSAAAGYGGSDSRNAPGGNAPPGRPSSVQVQQLAPPPGAPAAAPPAPPSPPPATASAPPAPNPPPPTVATAPGGKPPPAPQIASGGGTKFEWPLRGQIVLGYGTQSGGVQNDGINIAAAKGTPVKAAEAGSVLYAGEEVKGFGKLVLIGHNDGYVTAYANNDELLVSKGQRVAKGTPIAKVGQTGNVTSPQLHFEIRQKNKPVDPTALLGP